MNRNPWSKLSGRTATVQRTKSFKRADGSMRIQRSTYSTSNGMSVNNSWWDLVKAVNKRSGGYCEARNCKNKANEVHHIVRLSAGGTNSPTNLIHLCAGCHDLRHSHLPAKRGAK